MECGVPFCHHGCPSGNLIPGLERPRLPRPLARGDRRAPPDEQLPGVHRPALPGSLRGGVRARDPGRRCGHDQADRGLDHRPRVGRGVGRAAAARHPYGAHRGGGRRRAGGARVRAAAQPRPATRSPCSSATRRAAGSCVSAFPISRSRSGSSSGGSSSSWQRASSSATASTSASTSTPRSCGRASTPWSSPTGSRVPRDLPVPGRELGGVHFAMDYLYQRTRWLARELGAAPAGAPPKPGETPRSALQASTSS